MLGEGARAEGGGLSAAPRARSGKGWSFIFMVILIAGLYLGIGIGYNYKKMGLRGVEAVPNISFWRQVPGLVKDGVTFSAEQSKAGMEYVQQKYLRKG